MPKIPMPLEVLEAAARAAGENYWSAHNPEQSPTNPEVWKKVAEAAIRAAFDKLGLREEYAGSWDVCHGNTRWKGHIADSPEGAEAQVPTGRKNVEIEARFISDWHSVDRGSSDA